MAAASPDDDFLQAKAKFHTEVLDDIRSQIQDHVNLPYEATSDEELFIALTEQADAAYAEEGYDASARYRCYAEVLSKSLPQWMETPDREMLAEAGVDPRSLAPGERTAGCGRAGASGPGRRRRGIRSLASIQLRAAPGRVGVLLTHRPPCPPPSRVPSPGYAFPQPLTRITIVI